jgi:hypothetical protein
MPDSPQVRLRAAAALLRGSPAKYWPIAESLAETLDNIARVLDVDVKLIRRVGYPEAVTTADAIIAAAALPAEEVRRG